MLRFFNFVFNAKFHIIIKGSKRTCLIPNTLAPISIIYTVYFYHWKTFKQPALVKFNLQPLQKCRYEIYIYHERKVGILSKAICIQPHINHREYARSVSSQMDNKSPSYASLFLFTARVLIVHDWNISAPYDPGALKYVCYYKW